MSQNTISEKAEIGSSQPQIIAQQVTQPSGGGLNWFWLVLILAVSGAIFIAYRAIETRYPGVIEGCHGSSCFRINGSPQGRNEDEVLPLPKVSEQSHRT